MSDNIQQKAYLARQIAYEELKNKPEFKFKPIPQSLLDSETNKYLKLSLADLQKRVKQLPNLLGGTNKKQDLWDAMGLKLSPEEKQQANANLKIQNQKWHKIINNPKAKFEKIEQPTTQNKQVVTLSDKQLRKVTAETLYNVLSQASATIHSYADNNIKLFSGDTLYQFGKDLANIASFGNVETLWKEIDKIDSAVVKAQQLMSSDTPQGFNQQFKEITGIDYSNDAMQKFAAVIQKGIPTTSPKYKESVKRAFGQDYVDNTQKSVEGQAKMGSILGIAQMLAITFASGGLAEGMGGTMISTLGKAAGSAVTGAITMGTYTAATELAGIATKHSKTKAEDFTNARNATLENIGIGAFGGLLNATVVSKIVKAISKGETQSIGKAIGELTSKGEISGMDFMNTFLKSAKPNILAKTAGFATEVAGFTGYSIAEQVAKDMATGSKSLPKDASFEDVCAYIKNNFNEQLKSLGEIKVIGKLVMMMMGGRLSGAALNSMTENLKDFKVKSVNGKYEITLPDGKKYTTDSPDKLTGILYSTMLSNKEIPGQKIENDKPEVKGVNEVNEDVKPKTTEFKELTDAEFEAKKADILKKIDSNPELKNTLKYVSSPDINKYNIFVLDATLNSPKLLESIVYNLRNILYSTYTAEQAKARTDIIDKIGQNPKLLKNENFSDMIGDIISSTSKAEQAQVTINIIDEIKQHPEWLKLKDFTLKIGKIISLTETSESAKAKIDIMQELGQHPELFEYENFKDNIGGIICGIKTAERAKAKIDIMQELGQHPELFKYESFKNYIGNIIDLTDTAESVKAKTDIMDKIKQHPELLEYKNFTDNLGNIIYKTNTTECAKAKIDIMDKTKQYPELLKNKNFTDNLGSIFKGSEKKEKAQIKLKLINEYLNNENLAKNEVAQNSMGDIINAINTPEQCEFVMKYFNGDKSPIYSALDHALKNKNQLKSGIEDISDSEILKSFIENYKNIETTINMVGSGTFEASYPLKLDGVEDYAEDIAELKESLYPENYEALEQKINPTNSIEYKEKSSKLQNEITELKKQFPQAKAQGGENLQNLIKEINTKSRELKDFQSTQKITMTPQEIVSKTRALSGVAQMQSDNNSSTIRNLINVMDNNKQWTDVVNKTIYNKFGIKDYENLSQKLKLDKSEYLGEILSANTDFNDNFKILLKQVQDNPDLSITDALNKMPQNQETKKIYQEMGINYDKWVNVDKNSYIPITVKLNAEEAKQTAIKNMEEDFNDPAFNELPKEESGKLFNRLNNAGYTFIEKEEPVYDDDGITQGTKKIKHLYKDNKPIVFEDLKNINSLVKEELNSNSFWTTKMDNEQQNSTKETLYNHLMKLRPSEYENAKSIKDEEAANLEVRKVDMNDVSHSLFLGNHGACCTAVGTGINQVSAPTYVMNKCIGAIEVADLSNKNNSFAGNTMCYIAKVDGKTALILDNIELSSKYQGNEQIRDAIIKYARNLCKEIGTQKDGSVNERIAKMPIYAGPYRHKVDLSKKEFKKHDLQIAGSTGKQEVYIDYTTSPDYVIDNKKCDKVDLYKLDE